MKREGKASDAEILVARLIDRALRPLFDAEQKTAVSYCRRDAYTARMIEILRERGKQIVYDRNAAVQIPRGEIRTRNRILHNDLVYAVGVLLFQKGSKLRALLKRIL